MTDLEQRRQVMQHARKIGHCVCDLKKTCPCDMLRDRGICICAGKTETLDEQLGPDKT